MLYITQLIYVNKGEEGVFHQFEEMAIPIIAKYSGKLLLRIRTQEENFVEGSIDLPYEIQLVAFESEKNFEQFMQDKERLQFLHLKEQSVKSVLLVKGEKI